MRKITEQEKIEISNRLRPFQQPDDLKSFLAVLGNLFGLFTCVIGNYFLFTLSPYYTALLWIPTAAFLGRLFVCLHDCGHKNLFSSKRLNTFFGRVTGMCIGLPYKFWQHYHNIHHSIVNNRDRRHLDIESSIMTLEEYESASFFKRFQYDFSRNVVARIFIVPILLFVLNKIPFWFYPRKIIIDSTLSTLIYVALIILIGSIISFKGILLIYGVPVFITQLLAVTIFALQHKFENAYWVKEEEWDHFEVALFGSSFLKFGKFMNWYSGNVGFHHIHHLNPKIPFYNLPESERVVRKIVTVTPISLKNYRKSLKKKVWDYSKRRMVDPRPH